MFVFIFNFFLSSVVVFFFFEDSIFLVAFDLTMCVCVCVLMLFTCSTFQIEWIYYCKIWPPSHCCLTTIISCVRFFNAVNSWSLFVINVIITICHNSLQCVSVSWFAMEHNTVLFWFFRTRNIFVSGSYLSIFGSFKQTVVCRNFRFCTMHSLNVCRFIALHK